MSLDTLPLGMIQAKVPVLQHQRMAADHYRMRLRAPQMARKAKPGQFLHILCGNHEGAAGQPFLRRPFSLLDVNPQAGTVDFVYKIVGLGTESLAQIQAGSKVDVLGPLGQPFEFHEEADHVFLVGGGVGIPPLYFLAKWLKKTGKGKQKITAFLGAKTRKWVICASQFKKLGVTVKVATDDGSQGKKGSVVDLLKKALGKARGSANQKALYVCGPTPMMAAAARVAKAKKIWAQVSLEERMGCALGVCWGCVVEVNNEPVGAHARFQRVCTEGPVFQAENVLWR